MRIFDNHNKINWSAQGALINERNPVLSPDSAVSALVPIGGAGRLKLIGQKISGDGEFEVTLSKDNKIFFQKKLNFSKKGSSEFSIDILNIPNNFIIILIFTNEISYYLFLIEILCKLFLYFLPFII